MGEEMGTSGNRCQRFRLGWVTAGGGTDDRGKGSHPAQASGPSQTLALLLRAPQEERRSQHPGCLQPLFPKYGKLLIT